MKMENQQMVSMGHGTNNAKINVPLESINLPTWFFTLKDAEYAACSCGHNGMVQGRLPDGKRVSVSVETIGGNFILNNFVEEVAQRDHVRAVSNTVAYIGVPDGVYAALIKVTWETKLTYVSTHSCMFISNVTTETADMNLVNMLQNLPKSDSDPFQDHWLKETPLFAADIERKARMGMFD